MQSNRNEDFDSDSDIEAHHDRHDAISSSSPLPNSNSAFEQSHSTGMAAAVGGLELIEIEEESGPDPPIAVTESLLDASKEAHLDDGSTIPSALLGMENVDYDVGPDPPANVMEGLLGPDAAGKSMNAVDSNVRVELIDDDNDRPNPSNAMLDQDQIKKNKAKQANIVTLSGDEESILVPTEEEIADGVDFYRDRDNNNRLRRLIGSGGPPLNENNQTTAESTGPVDTDLHVEEEEQNNNNVNLDEEVGGHVGNSEPHTDRPALVENPSAPVIPEAFLVEERSDDGMVIHGHAEPLLPWWKQRRTKLLFSAFIGLPVILAVSLGVPLSLKSPATTKTNVIVATDSPSQSNAPSFQPSGYPTRKPSTAPSTTNFPSIVPSDSPSESPTEKPSTTPSTTTSPSDHPSESPSASLVPTAVPTTMPSITPSYSPSACVDQMSSNAKKIDLQIDDPYEPRVAVDGKDMVIFAQQGDWNGPVFIIFYTMLNGEWQTVNTFQEDGLGQHSSVALSDSTAFVGFRFANDKTGAVSTYEKDQYGDWNLMEDPFIHDDNTTHSYFGGQVDVDGDLACVEDSDGTYIYHKENNKWVQFDTIIGGRECSITGDTIATRRWDSELGYHLQLYKYNQQLRGVFPIQDPILTGYTDLLYLSNDYLVYWDSWEKEDAFMYRREDTNQTFNFLQRFNISGPEYNYGLVLDNDILVVGGNNKTHIFSEQTNGKWEETITLDQSYYHFALSGRSLLANSWSDDREVYYFDIAGCSQAMPTQAPSLSMAPSDLPSLSPSTIPSSTTAPSTSSSPTETCSWIQVAITYDRYPGQTSWQVQRVGQDWWYNELVKPRHYGSEGDTSYVEFLCLQEGEYFFTIYDYGNNGMCCDSGEGNYNVTSNGMLIVKGGEFERSERTAFSIPFAPSL